MLFVFYLPMSNFSFLLSSTLTSAQDDNLVGRLKSAPQLLENLHASNKCIFRLEPYWNYELCFGEHLRQFHEAKEDSSSDKTAEFFLGSRMEVTPAPRVHMIHSWALAGQIGQTFCRLAFLPASPAFLSLSLPLSWIFFQVTHDV